MHMINLTTHYFNTVNMTCESNWYCNLSVSHSFSSHTMCHIMSCLFILVWGFFEKLTYSLSRENRRNTVIRHRERAGKGLRKRPRRCAIDSRQSIDFIGANLCFFDVIEYHRLLFKCIDIMANNRWTSIRFVNRHEHRHRLFRIIETNNAIINKWTWSTTDSWQTFTLCKTYSRQMCSTSVLDESIAK
jgi:hypothetical protein